MSFLIKCSPSDERALSENSSVVAEKFPERKKITIAV